MMIPTLRRFTRDIRESILGNTQEAGTGNSSSDREMVDDLEGPGAGIIFCPINELSGPSAYLHMAGIQEAAG